ncbi:MAG: CRISPR-associated helicase Cas3' [Pyrinomonadaceae bacterium]
MEIKEVIKFWAKTSHDKDRYPNAFHPLICHLIDVAVVTRKIWDSVLPTATKYRINKKFGLIDAGNVVAFIAGLHDLGKCSPPFILRGHHDVTNAQTRRLLQVYKETDFYLQNVKKSADAPHGYVTTVELPQILIKKFNLNPNVSKQISIMIGGHHGVFPDTKWTNKLRDNEGTGGNSHWKTVRIEIAQQLANLLDVKPLSNETDAKLDNGTIMILAGLVSVADWIGSDTDFFESAAEFSDKIDVKFNHDNLENYFTHAETQAQKALLQLGWIHKNEKNKSQSSFENVTGKDRFKKLFKFDNRRHLQEMAIEIAKDLDKPGIAVIEAPTGEGKTEAAMFLADAWNNALNQMGYYFALPTQATSNQMFGRAVKFLENRYPESNVNVQLTHGHASLSAEFKTLQEKHKKSIEGIYDDQCTGDSCVPSVVAAEWFTYRKRSLLAPFGIGTIDQALMSVLQTKHVFVRLFGLAHKTVIVDEVHAYDAYMSTLLERLLEWLAALGSPVILLSATLPKERRNKLIEAYQRGLPSESRDAETRTSVSVPDPNDKYPRISYATDTEEIKIRHIETSEKSRTLFLEQVNDDFVEKLKSRLDKNGGCVAIICNTVKRSQELYERLSEDEFFSGIASDGEPKLDLLHARFRFIDREEREKRCLKRFEKPNENGKSPHRPKCAVLISTQIIEQSLDLDFDLMISDLAPIDLLLQRAGRLHRHKRKQRPKNLQKPYLWIIKPPTDDEGNLLANSNDLPDFGDSGFVYDRHVLLRTYLALKTIGKVEVPRDIENLIEKVYDFEQSMEEDLSESLKEFWQKTLEDCKRAIDYEKDEAENRFIKHPHFKKHISGIFQNNLEEDSPEIHKSLQAKTRLIEVTVSVVCLWKKNEQTFLDEDFRNEIILIDTPNIHLTKELLRRSVKISTKSVVFSLIEEEIPIGWKKSAHLRHQRVLIFDMQRNCEKFGYVFRLDNDLGLQITKKEMA